MFTVQLAPGATIPPQFPLCANSLAFVPVNAKPEITSGALPVLLNVTPCAGLVAPTI
jgi:hypothetical protein